MAAKPVSVITTDERGTIKTFNEGAEKLFLWNADDVIGKQSVTIFHTGEAVITKLPKILKEAVEKGHWEGESPLLRKDGTAFIGKLRIVPIKADNILTGYSGVTQYVREASKEELKMPLSLKEFLFKYVIITRAPFFTAILVPILLGTALAYKEMNVFDPLIFTIALLTGIFLHAGTNMINDYFDRKGDEINTEYVMPYTGGSRAIQIGLVSPQKLFLMALSSFAIGALLALYLSLTSGPIVLLLGVIGALSGYFYSAPPIRLSSHALGELFVGLNFGILATIGSYYVQTQTISLLSIFSGIPIGLLITAVLYINEFPDAKADKASGKNTLIVKLGKSTAILGYILLISLSYLLILFGALTYLVPLIALIALLPVPYAIHVVSIAIKNYANPEIKAACAGTIYLHLLTGLLLGIAFIIS